MTEKMVICPNGEGDPFSCNSFCALCEGEGEVKNCDEDNRSLVACDCGNGQHKMVRCLDCDDVLERDCEGDWR